MQKNPPAAIQISLYGAGEDTYEQVTGKRAFSLVMENLRRIKASGLPLTIAVTPSEYMTDAEQLLRLLDEEQLPFAINARILPPRPETGRTLADANQDTYVTCGAGRSGFAIDWKGDMRPCNNFPCEGENVLSLGFHEAWKRTNQTSTHYPLPAECEVCAYHGVCMHCVAAHAAGSEPGHANPAICAMGKRMVTEGLRSLNHK